MLCSYPEILATENGYSKIPAVVFSKISTQGIVSTLEQYDTTSNILGVVNANGTETIYVFNQPIRNTSTSDMVSECVYTDIQDTFVSSTFPSTVFGDWTYSFIGNHPTYGTCREYVKFEGLSLLGIDHERVISAYYHADEIYMSTHYDAEIEAYFVSSPWYESLLTWNNKPDYNNSEIITTLNMPNNHGDDISDFYITRAVKGWLQGLPNYGILLKDKDDQDIVKLYTKEAGSSLSYLAITYYPLDSPNYVSTNSNSAYLGTKGLISGETYYIYNKKSDKFLTAANTSVNASISQQNYTGTNTQQWTLVYDVLGDYYKLKLGSTNNYLQVNGTIASANRLLKLQSANTESAQRWHIVRNWDGSYQLQSLLDTAYAVSVFGASTAANAFACLNQHTVDFNLEDDWTIVPINKGTATIYTINNSTKNAPQMKSFLDAEGFSTIIVNNGSSQATYNALQEDSLYFYFGHGIESRLCLGDDEEVTASVSDEDNNVYALNTMSYNKMANMQAFVMDSCLTGRDDPLDSNNIGFVGTAYDRGSHFVTAHLHEVAYNTVEEHEASWRLIVVLSLTVGKNIYTALSDADEYLYGVMPCDYCNLNSRHTLGDNNIKITFDTASKADSTIETECLGTGSNRMFPMGIGNNIGKTFYHDVQKNVYGYNKNDGTLTSYIANIESDEIGNHEVDSEQAFEVAKDFLAKHNLSVEGAVVEHSGVYAKTFRISYTTENQKISLVLKADQTGQVFVTHFFKS